MKFKVGEVTASEIEVMLDASASDGCKLAESILNKQKDQTFYLTSEEAEYLAENLLGDCDRVAQAVGDAAGRAFEKAGEKLYKLIRPLKI